MALNVAREQITFTSGSTADVESSDLGFVPKAIIFFGGKMTGTGTSTAEQGIGYGFATGVGQQGCVAMGVSDNRTSDERASSTVRSDACYAVQDGTNLAVNGRVSLKSMTRSVSGTGQGFTLQVDDAFGGNYVVDCLVLGGSDVQSAFAGTLQLTSGAGNKSTTAPGFLGNCLLMATAYNRSSTINASTTAAGGVGLGAAVSASSRWSVTQLAESAATTSHAGVVSTASLARLLSGVTLEATLDFVSHDASGFTVGLAGSDTVRTPHVAYLYLKLAQAPELGTFQTQTSTGVFDAVTGLTATPKAVLAICRPEVTATETVVGTGADACEVSVGLALSSSDRCAAWFEAYEVGAVSAGNATETYAARATNRFLIQYDRASADTLSAIVGEVDFVDFAPSTGTGFRLNQTVADAQQTLVPFVAFLGSASGGVADVFYGGIARGLADGTGRGLLT